jgi:hypothetical protein
MPFLHSCRSVLGPALACAAALVGCAQTAAKPVDFSEATRDYRATDYPSVYESWTRHVKLVQEVGTVIEAWATAKSWDFRQAYVAYYASIYDLSDSDRATLLHAQIDASRASYEFHVAVQTTTDKWNDLERKNSPWRVTLLDATGAEMGPTSIQVVKLPELYESQFFPSRTEFTRTYEISFVRTGNSGQAFAGPASGRLVLRIASPMGRIELVWDVK